MTTHHLRRLVAATALGAVAVGATAVPASAHVTANPREAASGGYTKLDFRVPHGCDGAATEVVRVQVPEGVTAVKPQVVAGWEIEIVRTELDEPLEGGHGEQLTDRVSEVVWRGGPLSDEHLQEFGLSVRMPEGDTGDVIYFPSVQECEGGEEEAWIERPADGDDGEELSHPAPAVTLAAAGGGHGAPADGDDEANGDAARSTDDAELAAAVTDGGTDTLAVIALVVGGLALIAGLAGVALARRR